jgi:hypothetical protein
MDGGILLTAPGSAHILSIAAPLLSASPRENHLYSMQVTALV